MKDFETRVREAIAALPDDLAGFAAHVAMAELRHNWSAAIRDGAKPSELLPDLDHVITYLQRLRATVDATWRGAY